MRNVILLIIIFLLSINQFLTAQDYQNSQDSGDLIIIVNGLKNSNGDVQLGLFNSQESFNGEQRKFKGAIIKVENKMVIWEVKNVPFGEYAIKTFHDEDQNDEIDTNFIGIPTESYGFSNNAKAFFGPPSFEKAKFYFGLFCPFGIYPIHYYMNQSIIPINCFGYYIRYVDFFPSVMFLV